MNHQEVINRIKRLIAVPSVDKGNTYRILHTSLAIPKKLQNVTLSGESLWGNEKGIAKCTSIDFEFHYDNGEVNEKPYSLYIQIYVHHDRAWEIYTDKAFEKGVSNILTQLLGGKVIVGFTEQGMQENSVASLENGCRPADLEGSLRIADFIMHQNNV